MKQDPKGTMSMCKQIFVCKHMHVHAMCLYLKELVNYNFTKQMNRMNHHKDIHKWKKSLCFLGLIGKI